MKVDAFKKEIALLGEKDLIDKCNHLRKELFGLRLNAAMAHLKDYSHFAKLRKQIAQILTLLHQKNIQQSEQSGR